MKNTRFGVSAARKGGGRSRRILRVVGAALVDDVVSEVVAVVGDPVAEVDSAANGVVSFAGTGVDVADCDSARSGELHAGGNG